MASKKTIVKYVIICLWFVVGGIVLGLLVAAAIQKGKAHCSSVDINIHGFNNNFFIDKKDIEQTIVAAIGIQPTQKSIGSFDLIKLKALLEKNTWIKKATLFFDNNQVLHVEVFEREPIARIFTTAGNTFYIDTALMRLPVADTMAANVQVFTGFPSDNIVLSTADSLLLLDVKNLSMSIQKDSFCMAMIDQIDITSQRKFEMIPKIGNHIIQFGDATNIDKKMEKLKLFYNQVFPKAGMNYYSNINVQYDGQLVAKRRGQEDMSADSLRTLQIIQVIADNAAKQSEDSLQVIQQDNSTNTADGTMLDQSIERDEQVATEGVTVNPSAPATNTNRVPVNNRPVVQAPKPVVPNKPKPVVKPPARTNHPKPNVRPNPRAVMPDRRN